MLFLNGMHIPNTCMHGFGAALIASIFHNLVYLLFAVHCWSTEAPSAPVPFPRSLDLRLAFRRCWSVCLKSLPFVVQSAIWCFWTVRRRAALSHCMTWHTTSFPVQFVHTTRVFRECGCESWKCTGVSSVIECVVIPIKDWTVCVCIHSEGSNSGLTTVCYCCYRGLSVSVLTVKWKSLPGNSPNVVILYLAT